MASNGVGVERFWSMFYVTNAFLLVSWAWLRTLVDPSLLSSSDSITGIPLEVTLYAGVGTMSLLRFMNSATVDQFLATTFFSCKLVILVFLGLTSVLYGSVYLLVLLVQFAAFPQPVYEGPSKIESWTDRDYRAYMAQQRKNGSESREDVLVMFYTTWADTCMQLMPMFAAVSLELAEPGFLRCAKVNVGRHASLAQQHCISTSTSSKQLPTFILFNGGAVVNRMPALTKSGGIIKPSFAKADFVRKFALRERIETKKAAKGKPE